MADENKMNKLAWDFYNSLCPIEEVLYFFKKVS